MSLLFPVLHGLMFCGVLGALHNDLPYRGQFDIAVALWQVTLLLAIADGMRSWRHVNIAALILMGAAGAWLGQHGQLVMFLDFALVGVALSALPTGVNDEAAIDD
jgi:hypothetical protein